MPPRFALLLCNGIVEGSGLNYGIRRPLQSALRRWSIREVALFYRGAINGQFLSHSDDAVLKCGPVHRGDIIWLRIGIVGRVVRFWRSKGSPCINVQLDELTRCNANDPEEFSDRTGPPKFVDAESIVDACMWIDKRSGVIKVIAPFEARLE